MGQTVFEALDLENPSDEVGKSIQKIVYKCTMVPGYTRADAVRDLIKVIDCEDTPENRRIVAHAMTSGEMVQHMHIRLGQLSEMLGASGNDDDEDNT